MKPTMKTMMTTTRTWRKRIGIPNAKSNRLDVRNYRLHLPILL